MIYGITAFAGFETAAALDEEARNAPLHPRQHDRHRRTPAVAIGCVAVPALVLGLPLTYAYDGARTFRYLAGAAGLSVALIYLAVNLSAIRAFRTGFRGEFSVWRHIDNHRLPPGH
jgi:amino acid transporter